VTGSKNQRTDRTSSKSSARGAHIVNEVILRDQIQVALYELLHGYEEMTGLSVIRVHYDSERGRVSIDALPRP
jgi:hypothetical protein